MERDTRKVQLFDMEFKFGVVYISRMDFLSEGSLKSGKDDLFARRVKIL